MFLGGGGVIRRLVYYAVARIANIELREDTSAELREDGGYEVRE